MTTAAVTAAHAQLPAFRNEHLSVSRLKRFEECALAFYFQYVDKQEDPQRQRAEPAEFGVVLHDALERTYGWVVDQEYEGPFPEAEALEFFRLAWSDSGLVGVSLYQEGRDLVRAYAQWVGAVDHMRTLAIEREFNLLVGPGVCRLVDAADKERWRDVADHFVVNGFIDRVDRVDGETVEVVDYKSNRMMFSRDELSGDLQMGVYSLVARELFPWAQRVRLSFHMLRHGLVQRSPDRDPDDLSAIRDYLVAVGTRTERGPYEPRLNTHCSTCDHRVRCDTYKDALEKKLDVVPVSVDDLERLGAERERVASIAKAAYARKDRLDGILKSIIGDKDSIQLGDVVYRLQQYSETEYPYGGVRELFDEAGLDLTPAIRIDSKVLEEILKQVESDDAVPSMTRDFLRVRAAAKAVKVPKKSFVQAHAKKR